MFVKYAKYYSGNHPRVITLTPQFAAALTTGQKPIVSLTLAGQPGSGAAGYWRTFTSLRPAQQASNQFPWIQKMGAYSQTANDTDGSSSISGMSVTVLDYAHLITQDFPSIPSGFKGMVATIRVGFQNLAQQYWMTLATLVVDKVSSDNENTCYTFRLRDQSVILQQQVFQNGDNALFFTSSNNPRNVGPANPLAILQDVVSQVYPVLPINGAAVAAYQSGLLSGAQLKFSLTRSETAKSFIDGECFKTFGGYNFFNNLGQITPFFYVPFVPPVVVCSLDQTNLTKVPVADEADLINQVGLTMDYSSSSFGAEDIEINATSATLYQLVKALQIDSRGGRTAFGQWAYGRLLAHTLFLRYANFAPTYDVTAFWIPSAIPGALQTSPGSIELGDHVYLSGTGIPVRSSGTIGLTNRLCEVVGFQKDMDKWTVGLSLLDKGWLQALNPYQVAPDGAPVYASASAAQRQQYAYICSQVSGQFSNGDAGQAIY